MMLHYLDRWIRAHEIQHRVKNLVGIATIIGDARHSQDRTLPEILCIHFRNGHVKLCSDPLLQTEKNLPFPLKGSDAGKVKL